MDKAEKERNRKYDELEISASHMAFAIGRRKPVYLDYDKTGKLKNKEEK